MDVYISPAKAHQTARSCLKEKRLPEAETILRGLVSRFPENLEYCEHLLYALGRQHKTEEMLTYFREITERFNPTNDPVYDAIYIDGLRATSSLAVPLQRMLRFYELVKQLQRTLRLTGEVAECGCFRGMSSFLLCSYLGQQNSAFDGTGYHIFDSFQGLGPPSTDDDVPVDHTDAYRLYEMSRQGAFAASLEKVRHNLAAFPGVEYHPGWIPLTFHRLPEKKYRFVHVDVDLYDPTWDCLDYFYPRLVTGGVLLSDDYGWPGARKAIDEFCAERGVELTVTPYQQAVLQKML